MTAKKRAAPTGAHPNKVSLPLPTLIDYFASHADTTKKPNTSPEADTTNDPRRAALNLTEILENVLSFLPPRMLFGVQRVSRLWKSTIAASPPIQEKMFLRVRTKTPEIWMLTNPKIPPQDWHLGKERPGLDRKFRMVSETEMRSGAGQSRRLRRLFTPVTLNSFLHSRQGDIASEWIDSRSHIFWATLVPTAKFAQHNSFRDTYLTDPPCREVSVYMNYEAHPSPPMLCAVVGHVQIESDKPLTLGDIIDQTLASPDTWLRMGTPPGTSRRPSFDTSISGNSGPTLAQQIEKLEKRHNCSIVLRDQKAMGLHLRLSLPETIVRPLLLTDADYLRLKPTEQPSQ